MQVSCTNCGARYRLPSRAVPERGLRFRCKHCDHSVVVRGATVLRTEALVAGAQEGASGGAGDRVAQPVVDEMAQRALGADRQRNWYAIRAGVQAGPLRFEDLLQHFADGRVGTRTFVWHPSMPEWRRIADVPALVAATGPLGAGAEAGRAASRAASRAAVAVADSAGAGAVSAAAADSAGFDDDDDDEGPPFPPDATVADSRVSSGIPGPPPPEASFFLGDSGAQPLLLADVSMEAPAFGEGEGPVIPPDDLSSLYSLSQMVHVEQRSHLLRTSLLVGGGALLLATAAVLLVWRPWAEATDGGGWKTTGDAARTTPAVHAPPAHLPDPGEAKDAVPPRTGVIGEQPGGTIRTEEVTELGVIDLSDEEEAQARRSGSQGREAERARRASPGERGDSGSPARTAATGEPAGEPGARGDVDRFNALANPDDEKQEVPIPLPEAESAGSGRGAVTESALTHLLRRKLRQFGRCKHGDDPVKLTITLSVEEDGRVADVAIEDTESSGLGSAALRGCVQRIVETWEFPPQPGAQRFRRVIIL